MLCPICGEEIREGSKFCTKCGKPIPYCPTCGMVIRERTRFCTQDGTPLPEELVRWLPDQAAEPDVAEEIGRTVEQVRRGRREAPPAPRRMERRFCLECGRPCEPGETLCANCRAARTEDGERTWTEREHRESPVLKIAIAVLAVLLLALIAAAVFLVLSGGERADTVGGAPSAGETREDPAEDEDTDPAADTGAAEDTGPAGDDGRAEDTAPAEETGDSEEETPAVVPAEEPEEVQTVHRYEVVAADCSWQEAREACEARGGYLATITSEEEYQTIAALAEESGLRYLWLGGRLYSVADDWGDGCWITGEDWTYAKWYPGEPSKMDKDGTEELYLCLWCAAYEEQDIGWTFNDQRPDLVSEFSFVSGKIGYVCEYE